MSIYVLYILLALWSSFSWFLLWIFCFQLNCLLILYGMERMGLAFFIYFVSWVSVPFSFFEWVFHLNSIFCIHSIIRVYFQGAELYDSLIRKFSLEFFWSYDKMIKKYTLISYWWKKSPYSFYINLLIITTSIWYI
jgi:hypothetical protein